MSGADTQPLVSIGMPVYNAERYLAGALQAVLAQDHANFELIISDNASADRTEEICREFQKADPRIRYIRQSENIGAAQNFAFVVYQATGQYFMWAAHDDLFHASYVRKCVEKLEAHPEAVLCCTEINFIDVDGLPHSDWSNKNYINIETLGMATPQRVHELISRMGWFAIYGLMRMEAVRKISLGLDVYGADVIMLTELMLLDDFVKVHEPLFDYRIVKAKSAEDYHADVSAENTSKSATKTPLTDLAADLLRTVYASQLSSGEKTEIFADFLVTLTQANQWWREQIITEILGSGVLLNDSEFTLLLASVLSRSIPLEMMKGNPLMKVLCVAPAAGADLLEAAEEICRKRAAPIDVPASDPYDVRARLFGSRVM